MHVHTSTTEYTSEANLDTEDASTMYCLRGSTLCCAHTHAHASHGARNLHTRFRPDPVWIVRPLSASSATRTRATPSSPRSTTTRPCQSPSACPLARIPMSGRGKLSTSSLGLAATAGFTLARPPLAPTRARCHSARARAHAAPWRAPSDVAQQPPLAHELCGPRTPAGRQAPGRA